MLLAGGLASKTLACAELVNFYEPLKFLEEFELNQAHPLLLGDFDPLFSRKALFEKFFADTFADVPIFHNCILIEHLSFGIIMNLHFFFYVC